MSSSFHEKLDENHFEESRINLIHIFNLLWNKKLFIISTSGFFAIFSIIYALSLNNFYVSSSVLVAADSQNTTALSQYSGLASLAGIGMQGSGDSINEMIEIIESRKFVQHLITFSGVLPSIMAAESYNKGSKTLSFDREIYSVENDEWLREPRIDRPSKPSYLEAHKVYTRNLLSISKDRKTGVVNISIEHISPIFAKEFLDLIIQEANSSMSLKDIETSSKALTYLKEELAKTPLMEIKDSINQLIKTQLETQMMAKINEEYSLAVLEPPYVPHEKSKPSRSIIVIMISVLGGLFSCSVVLIMHYFKEKDS